VGARVAEAGAEADLAGVVQLRVAARDGAERLGGEEVARRAAARVVAVEPLRLGHGEVEDGAAGAVDRDAAHEGVDRRVVDQLAAGGVTQPHVALAVGRDRHRDGDLAGVVDPHGGDVEEVIGRDAVGAALVDLEVAPRQQGEVPRAGEAGRAGVGAAGARVGLRLVAAVDRRTAAAVVVASAGEREEEEACGQASRHRHALTRGAARCQGGSPR
jgi:hypothetical protein